MRGVSAVPWALAPRECWGSPRGMGARRGLLGCFPGARLECCPGLVACRTGVP